MSEKKGIDVGGGITLDDDEFATTPGLDFSISKKGTSVGARVQKPISKIDKENINTFLYFMSSHNSFMSFLYIDLGSLRRVFDQSTKITLKYS